LVVIAAFGLLATGCTVGDPGMRTPGEEGGPDAGGGDGDPDLPPSGTPTLLSIHAGAFSPLPDYAGEAFAGRAQMVRTLGNKTIVDVSMTGLVANTPHNAHVHALPCSALGGGHYMMDPAIEEPLETLPREPSDLAAAAVAGGMRQDRQRVLRRLSRMGVDVISGPPGPAALQLLARYVHVKRRGLIG